MLQAAEPIEKRVRKALEKSNAFWGLKAVALSNGKTLLDFNSSRYFVPASNTKLFATSLALTRLGPGYRFVTTIRKEGDDLAPQACLHPVLDVLAP